MRVGSLEVLNRIFCTICLGVNAQNFIFNVSIHGVGTFDYLCMSIENNIFSCINDNREFHLPCGKGIMDGKHAIISYSPCNLQRQRDLMISFQKLLSLKDT